MPKRGKTALVIAGGSIGMVYNEKQDAHIPGLSAEEILGWVAPEMAEDIEVTDWSHQPSSHYTIRMTTDLVEVMKKLVQDGVQGVVVTCGTDVLEEMAYLTDLLWDYPQPVIFTGAIIPSDLTGSDARINLHQSLLAVSCESVWGMGVLVCFQDQIFAASEISQVVSHRRDPFRAPGRGPLGEICYDQVRIHRRPRRPRILSSTTAPAREVELVSASLGGGDRILSCLCESDTLDGVVLAGFGLGNVPPAWLPHLKTLSKKGIPVVITSRCQQGQVNDLFGFEGTARRLSEFGVLLGGKCNPLQARLRLAVGLGAGLDHKALQEYLLEG
jgi:L-asparaginase